MPNTVFQQSNYIKDQTKIYGFQESAVLLQSEPQTNIETPDFHRQADRQIGRAAD